MKNFFKECIAFLLTWEARLILKKYQPKIIGVTGSVGKTSTKDAIYTVLAKDFSVRRSEKSFNSDIGIPLTILGCQNAWSNPIGWIRNFWSGFSFIIFKKDYPEWLVLEVGADRPGDIKKVSTWLKPDVVVLTKFAKTPVHIEFFKNREEVIKEKGYLVQALKHDGVLIINADDEDAYSFKGKYGNKTLTYSLMGESDICGSYGDLYYESNRLAGMQFKVDYLGNSVPMIIKDTVGNQVVYAALAAATTGLSQGMNLVDIASNLLDYASPKGRMKIIDGIKNTILIDDTYNSSPVALHSAIETLGKIKTVGRKIAVLGDMLELGKHSVAEHKEAGVAVVGIANILVTVGLRSRNIAESALDQGMDENSILQFEESKEAGAYLQNILRTNDVVLIKGSQSVRMEKCVEELMAQPERASELLVRQEEEWKKR
jgi:UDP-N-acetylmuramoyl-tripeptide--D-alanyl-D-alanine ligase